MPCPKLTTFVFSLHAQEGMQDRGIPEHQVRDTIEWADRTIEERPGICVYERGVGRNLILRVYVDTRPDPAIVITVYPTVRRGRQRR